MFQCCADRPFLEISSGNGGGSGGGNGGVVVCRRGREAHTMTAVRWAA